MSQIMLKLTLSFFLFFASFIASSSSGTNMAISSTRHTVSFFGKGDASHTQIKVTPMGKVESKETNRAEEHKFHFFHGVHRKLISATEHDTVNPLSPITIPQLTPVPNIVTVPSTNPVSETPVNPATNPLTVPTATPPINPVTTPSLGPPAITVPMTPPTLVYQAPPTTGISITPPVTTPTMNPVTPPATTNPPTASGQAWCVAKTGAMANALQAALDYACGLGGADCSAIQPSGSCYNPNSPQNHASYAFNSYYQKNPVPSSCDFKGTATLVNINPSSASCIYPSSSSSPATTPSTTSPPATPTTLSPPATPTTLSPPATTPITLSPPQTTPITLSPPASTSSSNEPPPVTPTTFSPPATTSPNFPPYMLNSSTSDSSAPSIYGSSPPPGSSSSVSSAASLQPLFAPILLLSLILTGRLCIM